MNLRSKSMMVPAVLCTVLLGGCEFFMSDAARVERAEKALASGEVGAAIVDLKNVLQDDAGNAQARLLLAEAQLRLGDVQAAAADFAKVDAAQVQAEAYQPLRWQLALATGQVDQVLAGLRAPVAGLGEPERLTLLARAKLGKGETAGARDLLEQALKAAPKDETAHALYATVLGLGGDTAGAIAHLKGILGKVPQSVLIHRALGEAHGRARDLPAAEAAYRKAFELAEPRNDLPGYLGAASGLGDALLAQNKLDEAAQLNEALARAAPNSGITLMLRGRTAAAKRDYVAALEAFTPLLNAAPDNPQVRTMVAAVNLEQGNAEQALAHLQRVVAANPDYAPARRLLAQVQMAQGRAREAMETLGTVDPETASPDMVLAQARAALAAGETEQATRLLAGLESQGVSTESVRLDLAAAFLQTGQTDRALKLLGESPESGGDQRERLRLVALARKDRNGAITGLKAYADEHRLRVDAVSFAALALATLGEAAEARSLLERLVVARPDDPAPLLSLAGIQARLGQFEGAEASLKRAQQLMPSVQTQLALAEVSAARGNQEEAIRWLESARAADPKAVQPRALLARVYLAQGNFDLAQKATDELVPLLGNRPDGRVLAATIAVQRNDLKRALQEVNEAVRLAPDSAFAWIAKGEIHERGQQTSEARLAYQRALNLATKSPLAAIALARLEATTGNPEDGLEAARRAQQSPETRAVGLRLEAELMERMERYADAIRAYETMLRLEPSTEGVIALYRARLRGKVERPESVLIDWIGDRPRDVATRAALAEHFQRIGDRPRAIREYETTLKFAPDNPVLLNNLAWLYQETGDLRALSTARRAHELAPRHPAITDTLGWILVNSGQAQEGLKLLREAAAAAPGSADIQFHLAQALSRTGDRAGAKQVADRLLQAQLAPEMRTRVEEFARTLR